MGLVSVYAARTAGYGSIPSTMMEYHGATSELWLTLLSEEELFHMDRSEGRGDTYDLVELPSSSFRLEGGISISPVSAYYQPQALRDPETGQPILLDCFKVTGTDLPSMDQAQLQRFVDRIAHGVTDSDKRSDHLALAYSMNIQLSDDACVLDPKAAPSCHSAINAPRET
jgi:hypothetical protein